MDIKPIKTGNEKLNTLRYGEKLRLPWYFETWFEKLIVVFGTLSLFYSIVRIIFQGVW